MGTGDVFIHMTTIGQKLREAREDQRLTIEKVFEATRIRVQYLQALEEDDHSVMPSAVQARGYLRNYAEFLRLDVAKLLDEMREATAQTPPEVVLGPADVVGEAGMEPNEPPRLEEALQVDDTTPLIKPKPVRRKRTEPALEGDSATTPRRRSRKKSEPESDPEPATPIQPVVDVEPELAEEPTVTDEPVAVETTPVLEENSDASVDEPDAPATQPVTDVNDSLWQQWLNRLTSVLSAHNRRSTLVPKADIMPEIESEPAILTDEMPQVDLGEQSPAAENSTQIFKEIGSELRTRREMLSLHLEEVERNTHVKAHYLIALENGAMDDLPSTVQTRGMLSNYATFLDLDVDTLLLRFADALQTRHRERNPLTVPGL